MRNVSAQAFIDLPNTDALETVALMQKLEAQVDANTVLPDTVKPYFDDLSGARVALAASNPKSRKGGAGTQGAHHEVQVTWAAAEQYLGAFLHYDDADDPAVPIARSLYGTLFGEGLGFLKTRVEAEWVESQRKIDAVSNGTLHDAFERIGGGVFWRKIVAAHQSEGIAAHLTTPSQSGPGTNQRELILAAKNAMREYVVHVLGSVVKGQPAPQALADKLLLPIAEWKSTDHHATDASSPTPPAPAGATPAANPKP